MAALLDRYHLGDYAATNCEATMRIPYIVLIAAAFGIAAIAHAEAQTSLPPGCTPDDMAVAQTAGAGGYRYSGACNVKPTDPDLLSPRAARPAANTNFAEALALGDMSRWEPIRNSPAQEWVPKGETSFNWSERITITPIHSPRSSVLDVVTLMLNHLHETCGVAVLSRSHYLQTDPIRKAAGVWSQYPIATALVACENPVATSDTAPGTILLKHEAIMFVVIQGQLQDYIVTRNWHGDSNGPDSVLKSARTREAWDAWAHGLNLVSDPKAIH